MKERKIGTYQAISIVVTVMISHIILNLPNHLITQTGSSTLLNLIYIFAITLIIFGIAVKIFKLFPNNDIIDICEYSAGKTAKNIFAVFIFIYLLVISAFVIRTFAESLIIIYFPNIDIELVILIFIAITAIMNFLGLKSIARTTIITLPIILLAMIVIFFSAGSDLYIKELFLFLDMVHLRHLFLVFGNIFAFSSMFILALMMPLIGDGNRFKKIGLISIIIFFIYRIFHSINCRVSSNIYILFISSFFY